MATTIDECQTAEVACDEAQVTEVHDPTFCPINAALTMLNGRWTPHIVHALLNGQTRFNEMARTIGINPRTLRERLREMEEDGIISRKVLNLMPPSVEYTLTAKGQALEKVFDAMGEWGRDWLEPPSHPERSRGTT